MLIQTIHMDKTGVIYFQNDPLNLLSVEFIEQLNQALDKMETDDAIRSIILTSDKKVFCAGANVKEFMNALNNDSKSDCAAVSHSHSKDPIEHWQHLAQVTKPVIACVTGACLGGGLEIALMCDFIIASEKASFGFPEIKLGLLPGGGGTQRILNRISSAHARELIMFGDTLDAEKALNWGLVNAVFSNPECFEKTLAFAEKLNQQSPDSLKAIKHLLSLSSSTPLEQRLITEREAFYDRLNSTDAQTRINAFFNRNK